ncbi:MAG TPA: hypothetical protein VNO43_04420 [Candidatus Eisenbacteria bacterium]|nr:hypothetical protein [Candidatus Eisenbacteria bacterium]
MLGFVQRFRPLISNAAGAIYKYLLDARASHADARIAALEKGLEMQAALNETVEMRIKIVQSSLESVQKTLRIVILGVIATATLAGLALTVALLR